MKARSGQITIFLCLLLPIVISLFGVTLESAYYQGLRCRIARAVDLAEYSFLSEYQPDLWEKYHVFYVDTGFGGAKESEAKVNEHIKTYLEDNLSYTMLQKIGKINLYQASCENTVASDYSRATDSAAMDFYEQAVAFEKASTPIGLLDNYLQITEQFEPHQGEVDTYEARANAAEHNYDVLATRETEVTETTKAEDGTEITTSHTEIEHYDNEFSGIFSTARQTVLNFALPEGTKCSTKSLPDPSVLPSGRALLSGFGPEGLITGTATDEVYFFAYLMKHFSNAVDQIHPGAMDETEAKQAKQEGKSIPDQQNPKNAPDKESKNNTDFKTRLDYEMEYLVSGKSSDSENLMSVVKMIFLIREVMNLAYLETGPAITEPLRAVAAAADSFTAGLGEVFYQVALVAWSFVESAADIRIIMSGNACAMVKNEQTWHTGVGSVLAGKPNMSKLSETSDPGGFTYRDFLILVYLKACALGRGKIRMRCMDLIEQNLRLTEKGANLYVDQLVDAFKVQTDITSPYVFLPFAGKRGKHQFTSERRFAYDWY